MTVSVSCRATVVYPTFRQAASQSTGGIIAEEYLDDGPTCFGMIGSTAAADRMAVRWVRLACGTRSAVLSGRPLLPTRSRCSTSITAAGSGLRAAPHSTASALPGSSETAAVVHCATHPGHSTILLGQGHKAGIDRLHSPWQCNSAHSASSTYHRYLPEAALQPAS